MSEHKWDRVKKSFGVNPSSDLLENRTGKINLALGMTQTAIDNLAHEGLDPAALIQKKTVVQAARDQALRMTDAKKQYEALGRVKAAARALRTEATDQSIGEIDDLVERGQEQQKAYQEALAKANGVTHPLVSGAATALRNQAEQARANAQRLATRKLRADAMDGVVTGFVNGIEPLAKISAAATPLVQKVPEAEDRMAKLPQGKATATILKRVQKLRERYDALPAITDMTALAKEAENLNNEADGCANMLRRTEEVYEGVPKRIELAEKRIGQLVDRAGALITAGSAALQSPLDDVTNAVRDAKKIADPLECASALEDVCRGALKPLHQAVFGAGADDGGLTTTLAGLAKTIEKLPTGSQKKTLGELLDDLQQRAATARTLDAPAAKKEYATLKDAARKLLDQAARARGEDGFRDAIAARFGIEIKEQDGAVFSLEKTYEMLDLVPDSHAIQDLLRKIRFSAEKSDAGDYSKKKMRITMEKIDSDATMDYEIGGKTVKLNEFNAMMLHEIGHAVDDKFKIMSALGKTAGFGLWNDETLDSVVDAITTEAVGKMGKVSDQLRTDARAAIRAAHLGNDPVKPQGCGPLQWRTLKKYTDIAKAVSFKADPWFNASPSAVKIGKRVYLQAYESTWCSYDVGERAKIEVRNYQWRAPGEWFAEIYAVSWIAKKVTPSNVPRELAEYLPR